MDTIVVVLWSILLAMHIAGLVLASAFYVYAKEPRMRTAALPIIFLLGMAIVLSELAVWLAVNMPSLGAPP